MGKSSLKFYCKFPLCINTHHSGKPDLTHYIIASEEVTDLQYRALFVDIIALIIFRQTERLQFDD